MDHVRTGLDSFLELRTALDRALDDHDVDGAESILQDLAGAAASAIEARELEDMIELRAHVARLRRRVGRRDGSDPAAEQVIAGLEMLDGMLDRGRTATLLRRAAQERERAAGPLRQRILRVLAEEPLRPREIAERCHCHPSQVSRVLRDLEARGRVAKTSGREPGSDRRAIWYEIAAVQAVRRHAVAGA